MAAYTSQDQQKKPVDPKDPKKVPVREIEVTIRAKEYSGGRFEFELVNTSRVPGHRVTALLKQFVKSFLAGRVNK